MSGGAEDPDAPCRVLDDGEDVKTRPGQGSGLEEVAGEQRVGLAAQEVGPGRALPFGRGWDAVLAEDLTVEAMTLMPSAASSAWIRR